MNCIAVLDPKSSYNTAKISGKVMFHQCSLEYKTCIKVMLTNVKPSSTLGFHIHKAGDLSKGCASACEHYNPHGTQHGSVELYGTSRHVGDMINNIVSDESGKVDMTFYDDLVDLSGQYSVAGRSIVIHEKADDLGRYRDEDSQRGKLSATTGDAGSRVACAVIGISGDDYHPIL